MIISYREDGKITKKSNMRILTHILVYDYMVSKSRKNGNNEIEYIKLIDDVAKQLQYDYFPLEMLYNLRLSVIGSVNTMIHEYGLKWFRDFEGVTYIEFEPEIGKESFRVSEWVNAMREFRGKVFNIKSSSAGLERYYKMNIEQILKKFKFSDVRDLLRYLDGTSAYLKESARQKTKYSVKYDEEPTSKNIRNRYEKDENKRVHGHEPFLRHMVPPVYVDKYKKLEELIRSRKVG